MFRSGCGQNTEVTVGKRTPSPSDWPMAPKPILAPVGIRAVLLDSGYNSTILKCKRYTVSFSLTGSKRVE